MKWAGIVSDQFFANTVLIKGKIKRDDSKNMCKRTIRKDLKKLELDENDPRVMIEWRLVITKNSTTLSEGKV